jgi:hypothetical protein
MKGERQNAAILRRHLHRNVMNLANGPLNRPSSKSNWKTSPATRSNNMYAVAGSDKYKLLYNDHPERLIRVMVSPTAKMKCGASKSA